MSKSYFLAIGLFLFFLGCSEPYESVDSRFENGNPKIAKLYKTKTDTSQIIGEKHYYENGAVRLISYFDENGLRTGKWEYLFESGKPWSICEYKNGKKHGKITVWYDNNQIRYTGNYTENQETGTWQYFDESGKLIKEVNY